MKSFLDEDGKEGRYFPTESEMPILVHYLNIYFNHPERSIQRSQVVQNVVSLLAQSNKHWSHRTVRLWFNNNKRVFFHQSPMNNQPVNERKEMVTFAPPKKQITHQPPRSLSVVQFAPTAPRYTNMNQPMVQQQAPPQPVQPIVPNGTLAWQLNQEKENQLSHSDNLLKAQLESEHRISAKLTNINEQMFEELLYSPRPTNVISTNDAAEVLHAGGYQTAVPFELVEAGVVGPDGAAVVGYRSAEEVENGSKIYAGSAAQIVGLSSPVSSVCYSPASDAFVVHADSVIQSFDSHSLEHRKTIKIVPRHSRNSALTTWESNLVLASGSSIVSWTREAIDRSDAPEFSTCFSSYISPITSLCTFGGQLVVASASHHTPHVFASNGTIVWRPIGHVAGITATGAYDSNCLLTGSADMSAKLWDQRIDHEAFTFLRHRGVITAVHTNERCCLVFTGGTDNIVRVWDLRMGKMLRALRTGPSAPLEIGLQGSLLNVIVSEKVTDTYCDLQRYGTMTRESFGLPSNGVITINLAEN